MGLASKSINKFEQLAQNLGKHLKIIFKKNPTHYVIIIFQAVLDESLG